MNHSLSTNWGVISRFYTMKIYINPNMFIGWLFIFQQLNTNYISIKQQLIFTSKDLNVGATTGFKTKITIEFYSCQAQFCVKTDILWHIKLNSTQIVEQGHWSRNIVFFPKTLSKKNAKQQHISSFFCAHQSHTYACMYDLFWRRAASEINLFFCVALVFF